MLSDAMGPAQVAAIAVLFQRALEECYSQYNTQQLLKHGAHEEGRSYYPTVAVTHLSQLRPQAHVHQAYIGERIKSRREDRRARRLDRLIASTVLVAMIAGWVLDFVSVRHVRLRLRLDSLVTTTRWA